MTNLETLMNEYNEMLLEHRELGQRVKAAEQAYLYAADDDYDRLRKVYKALAREEMTSVMALLAKSDEVVKERENA